jgi:uncharacterized protein (TIGR02996 family)
MRIEPGIGWGNAKLGMTRRDLVRALGRPTKSEAADDCVYESWESQGVRATLAADTQELDELTVFSNEPGFTRARLDGSDVAFGMSEATLIELLGAPIDTARGAFVQLMFRGLTARLVDGVAVAFTIERDPDDVLVLEPQPSNPELEAAIAANPDDRSAYLVFGDWLTAQGHPRGALIAEHAAGATIDKRQAHLLFGEKLARVADLIVDRTWRLGFLEKVKVASNPERRGGDLSLGGVLEMLLDSLAGRFVRDLTLGISTFESNDYGHEMQVIGAKPRPLLRSLYVGDFEREETELNWSSLGDASVMWAALPNLRELTLRSGTMELGEIVLPELRSFATRTGGLSKANLKSIALARWPKLEHLDVQIGSTNYGCDVELHDFTPLLERLPPSVRHLGLTNTEHSDALVPLLAASPALRQLESLDLSLGTLGVAGGEALIAHHTRFAHLKKLDLSESWLADDLIDRIREKLPQAIAPDQQGDEEEPDNRYIAAGE